MHQNPASDDFKRSSAEKEHELRSENQEYKVEVLILDSVIDQSLGQKRKCELYCSYRKYAKAELKK